MTDTAFVHPRLRLLALAALAKSLAAPDVSRRHVAHLIQELDIHRDAPIEQGMAQLLMACQIWTDAACGALPAPDPALGISLFLKDDSPHAGDRSFVWATRLMTARYTGDRDMFEALVGSISSEGVIPMIEGICAVLFLTANILGTGTDIHHEIVEIDVPDSLKSL